MKTSNLPSKATQTLFQTFLLLVLLLAFLMVISMGGAV